MKNSRICSGGVNGGFWVGDDDVIIRFGMLVQVNLGVVWHDGDDFLGFDGEHYVWM